MDPKNNFLTFDTAALTIVSAKAGSTAPTEALVRNSGVIGPASATKALTPHNWADLTPPAGIAMTDPAGTGRGTTFDFGVLDGRTGKNLTKIHAVNSKLAIGSNVVGNIFIGTSHSNLQIIGAGIEYHATGFNEKQSWQQVTGQTLATSFPSPSAEFMGKNAAGNYYYNSKGGAAFPAVFYDPVNTVNDAAGIPHPSIKLAALDQRGIALEYISKPTYGLAQATLIPNMQNLANQAYQVIFGDNKEVFPTGVNSEIQKAAEALELTFANAIEIHTNYYTIDYTQIPAGKEVPLDQLDWKKQAPPPFNRSLDPPTAYVNVVNNSIGAGPPPAQKRKAAGGPAPPLTHKALQNTI